MKVLITLDENEAYRDIEDEFENIIEAYKLIIKGIEDVCVKYKIPYDSISMETSEPSEQK